MSQMGEKTGWDWVKTRWSLGFSVVRVFRCLSLRLA